MTMEYFGDSDVDTFSDTSSDDQDDIFSVYGGHAQNILSSLEDSIGKIDDFLSFERGFMHGDIVCSIENPSGQMGKIVNVEVFVDLKNIFGKVMKDVRSQNLLRMRSISVGDLVIYGPWLGRVDKVVEIVGVLFDNGMKCEIMANDQVTLFPLSPNLLDDFLYPYHPGQRVKVSPSSGSKSGGWFCGISKKNQSEGTVISVEVGFVCVDWITSAEVGSSVTQPPPPSQQLPKNLTLLPCFSHVNWQLGDWCILPVADESSTTCVASQKKSGTVHQKMDSNWKFDEMFSIVKKKIRLDVIWQDGSCSKGLDSFSLCPVSVVNAHEFFPQQFVLEKSGSDDSVISTNRRLGLVRSVDANERTVKVKWKNADVKSQFIDEETVSAYELVEHPDLSFNVGDIVFQSDNKEFSDKSDGISMEDAATLAGIDVTNDLSEFQKKCFLSRIGYVVGYSDIYIKVQWAAGVTTEVAPYNLLRMEKDDGSVVTHAFHEDAVTEFNDELGTYGKHSVHHQDSSDKNGTANGARQNDLSSSRFLTLSQAAVGFFASISSSFFRSQGSSSLPEASSCSHVIDEAKIGSFEEQHHEFCDIISGISAIEENYLDDCGRIHVQQDFEENSDAKGLQYVTRNEGSRHFRQFDVVGDCSDHHFVDGVKDGSALFQIKKSWLKKVQQDWSILEKDLPETISVRVYEERMDLLRAAIVGAPGTPYHDGLFFFDILLPPDYPCVPPLVHYHSGGLRLNPNLYESGKVCLSLLNTWTGTGSEVWNPGSSTILQVLLSLQALVLNSKPYFNEAGYDKQVGRLEGEKNSVSYNEIAYLGTCKSMLYLLRKPPKNFERLVNEHFERRSKHILATCKAYMEGAPIGSETIVECEKGNSTGFKILLAKIFPKLVEAFSNKGIDCRGFIDSGK